MKILVVARHVPEREELDLIGLPAAAARRGHYSEVIPSVLADAATVDYGRTFDLVICRFSSEPRASSVTRALASMGIPIVGGDNGRTTGDDQVATLGMLRAAGVPVPSSVVVQSLSDAERAGARLGYPVVLKHPLTMGGGGVRLAPDVDAIRQHYRELGQPREFLVQHFYRESAGQDHRLFVVGSDMIGSVRRVADRGEFRANLRLGGTAYPHFASPRERALAVTAAYEVGLDVAGVDILETCQGPVVVEVNHNPGATGIDDAADAIVRYAERRVDRDDE